ncbi:MAG: hypothetical protein GX310_06475 [Synergistaceae bacterium]|nr:hypothetical protein [Synergistaceae bacterium]
MAVIERALKGGGRFLLRAAGLSFLCMIGGSLAAGLAEEAIFSAWVEESSKSSPVRGVRYDDRAGQERGPTLSDFAAADPFGASSAVPAPKEPEKKEITAGELYALEGIRIAGAIPGISAWIEEGGKQAVYLPGYKIKGFELLRVLDEGIVLHKDGAEITVSLKYGGKPSSDARAPAPARPPQITKDGGIAAARPGRQGSIPRETVDNLLMNPLDEMKKFRLRPAFDGSNALGVEVQWMDRGSFLEEVGVEKGDVIQSVNGLEIRNMGDVVNVVNSLMGGDAFDVQVLRGGQTVSLKYNIR